MQYLLSEEEYLKLKSEANVIADARLKKFFEALTPRIQNIRIPFGLEGPNPLLRHIVEARKEAGL